MGETHTYVSTQIIIDENKILEKNLTENDYREKKNYIYIAKHYNCLLQIIVRKIKLQNRI